MPIFQIEASMYANLTIEADTEAEAEAEAKNFLELAEISDNARIGYNQGNDKDGSAIRVHGCSVALESIDGTGDE